MLSCLTEDISKARCDASKTTISKNWFSENNHHPIDFELSWCKYFNTLKSRNITPIDFKRSIKFLSSLKQGIKKGSFEDFSFANPKKLNLEDRPLWEAF